MSKQADNPPEDSASTGSAVDSRRLAQGIGLLIYNTVHHNWLSKTDETETLASCYNMVTSGLEHVPEIVFRVRGDRLSVDGETIDQTDLVVRALVQQLRQQGIDNFSLKKGIKRESLAGLIEVITADPAAIRELGGFASALAACKLEHVTSKTVVYKEVDDSEVVVSREDLAKAREELEQFHAVRDRVEHLAELLAHLELSGGSGGGAPAEVGRDLLTLAPDAQRLAELVVEAARLIRGGTGEGPRGGDGGGGDSPAMPDAVAGSLRQTFKAMMNDPSAQTQKAKRELRKTLRELESSLLEELKNLDAPDREACAQAVAATARDIEEDIQVDALASEYMKRLQAMEQTEQRLMRYMKRKEAGELEDSGLKDRLETAGLSPFRWDGLLAKTGKEGASGGGLAATFDQVAGLLSRIERSVEVLSSHQDEDSRQSLVDTVQAANDQVDALVADTAQRIRDLAEDVRADEEAANAAEKAAERQGISLRLSRARLLAMLAEIVQELCQPLSVIGCALDMMNGGKMGNVSEDQKAMLALITDSTFKLRSLIAGLESVVGVPESMSPDREMLDRVTERGASR